MQIGMLSVPVQVSCHSVRVYHCSAAESRRYNLGHNISSWSTAQRQQ